MGKLEEGADFGFICTNKHQQNPTYSSTYYYVLNKELCLLPENGIVLSEKLINYISLFVYECEC